MRVTYYWTDNGGDNYTIEAEVHPLDFNKISIVNILTEDGVEVDFDDYDDEEKKDIRWAAKQAAEELDKLEESPDNDSEENYYEEDQ